MTGIMLLQWPLLPPSSRTHRGNDEGGCTGAGFSGPSARTERYPSPMSVRARQDLRLSAGARGLGLLALVIPVLWSQERAALVGLVAVAVIWCLAQLAQARHAAGPQVLVVAEALAVGVVCGLVLPTSVAVLGSLAVPAFTAGLRLGWRGVALAVAAQTGALL